MEYSFTKSQYTDGLTCEKKLWLTKNRPDLRSEPSVVQEAIFTQGHEVGELAKKYFEKESVQFEVSFVHEGVFVRVDVLKKNSDGTTDLIEVKSSTKPKDIQIEDLSLQHWVVSNSGTPIHRSYLMHLNPEYVRGEKLDIRELFVLSNETEAVLEKQQAVSASVKRLKQIIFQKNEIVRDVGSHCKNPYICQYKDYCWKPLSDSSIHYLGGLKETKRRELLDQGLTDLKKIPKEVSLVESQRREIQSWHNPDNWSVFDSPSLKKHLKMLEYPLHFLDFETVGYAIPLYPGTKPYEHLVFQFSLHVQEYDGAPLVPTNFLYADKKNPSEEAARMLTETLGDQGSIVVFHASFERAKIKALADRYLEYRPMLEKISKRIWDLETPFAKRWIWHPKLLGSSSIKKVLPVAAPNLSYGALEIQGGDQALVQYQRYLEMSEGTEKTALRKHLIEYCQLDSRAMAEILSVIQAF